MSTPTVHFRPDEVLSADYGRLRARLRGLQQARVAPEDARWASLSADLERSRGKRQQRQLRYAAIAEQAARCDEALPISARADDIVAALRNHPVLVIAGETGSGKTTQLPKLCLAAGRGVSGMIGCTQPRRIAARSVARRVAEEIGTPLGDLVGFQVRFTEQVGEAALVKFMTDGILLAEIQSDPWLSRYDTIIVDEAHERSLNVDFLLGYLKKLLKRRPDLKLIVTSATIDTARFAAHFDGAPVLEVEGRSYPVEVRYRPPTADEDGREPSLAAQITATVEEIGRTDPHGDVLVFLPGEREIRDAHLALARRKFRATEVVALYARLSAKEQDRVFHPGTGRRIVLATNVAETSLTVPRIRYVIDPGTARVNRYSHRLKVQRLHIEPVARSSANQRAGRCGRVGPGVCYRLYEESDYATRPAFADPELARSALAGVILRLLHLKLGRIEDFAFLDPPNERAVADGYQQLVELGALGEDRSALTDTGRQLARLPIDVKLARMLVEAGRQKCLREMLVLTAFLSIQDPRERPADAREAADRAQAAYADKHSDFRAVLKLWDDYRVAHEDLTQSKLRDWCEQRFLSFLRMREWRELHRQLLLIAADLGMAQNDTPAEDEPLHRALLSGLPGQIGRKDEKGQYQGTRGRRFLPFPGSGLAKHPPAWMLSAIYLDTARLYGLMNARVEPLWVEQQAAHLVKRRQFDPHWSRRDGRVLAYEQVTLFGLVLAEKRRVQFDGSDPAEARKIFLRDALVAGDIDCRSPFVAKNTAVLAMAREEEAKRRRQGLLKSEDELIAWLDARIEPGITSVAGLDAWTRRLDGERRRGLEWSLADVLDSGASAASEFPAQLVVGAQRLALHYRFEPGHEDDGVSLDLPLALLNAIPPRRLDWLVPGLLVDKVAELIRGLPKALRRNFVPAPDFARAAVEAMTTEDRESALPARLSAVLLRITGVEVDPAIWNLAELPPHLKMNLRLVGNDGSTLDRGRDIDALRTRHGDAAREAFAGLAARDLARSGLTRFELDRIPERVDTEAGVAAFPALVDEGASVAIRVFDREDEARTAHRGGALRLLRMNLAEKLKSAKKQLPLSAKTALAYSAVASPDALREDIVEAALLDVAAPRLDTLRSRAAFEQALAELGRELFAAGVERARRIDEVGILYAAVAPKLTPPLMGYARANYDDLRSQLAALVYPGFARELPLARLTELPRYLKAMQLRVERLQQDPAKDQARMLDVAEFSQAHADLARRGSSSEALDRLRWLVEEYRVQLFAQEVGTAEPVSQKRLRRIVQDLRGT